MILVDFIGHMVSTENEEQLHKFARELGMKKGWYQDGGNLLRRPHYGLTTSHMIDKALGMGAVQVSPAELARRAWWRK